MKEVFEYASQSRTSSRNKSLDLRFLFVKPTWGITFSAPGPQ